MKKLFHTEAISGAVEEDRSVLAGCVNNGIN